MKVKEISKNFRGKLKEVRNSESSKIDKFKKFRITKSEKEVALKLVLTDKQFITYLEFENGRKADRHENV